MWSPFKHLLSKSKSFRALLGDVLFQTKAVSGQSSSSAFQWQVKKGLDEKSIYIAVKMKADGYIGPEGSPTRYISFDLQTAEQLRADVDKCIAVVKDLTTSGSIANG